MSLPYISYDDFERYLALMRKTPYLIIDTEGTLNHPFSETWGISISAFNITEYFAFNHIIGNNLPSEWLYKLKEVIENHPCLVFHHAKHDLRALQAIGINYTGKFYCTMLMAHMINENLLSKELDFLSKLHGGEPKNKSETMQSIIKAFGWEYVPVDMMREYALNDAFITAELFYKLLPQFQEQELDGELWEIEQKFVRLLIKIENNGILIDQELSQKEYDRGINIMGELQKNLNFNPNSPKQLSNFLLNDLGLPIVKKTPKENACFDKEAMQIYDQMLAQRNDKRAKQVLAYRGWSKTTSSNYLPYLTLLHKDGRLRPNFKMHGTRTGRLSCEKPNLQQIPRESANDWNGKTKEAIIVASGRRGIEFDYSQLEFRIGAAYGGVDQLIAVFNDSSRDVFSEMASDLGMSRQDCKTLNYTLQFGGGVNRISHVFGISPIAAQNIIHNYYSNYPGLAKIAKYAEKICRERKYVRYWSGRRRHINSHEEYRKAFNSLCQGGAFEVVKRIMLAIEDAGLNNDECRMDLQVHDSIRFDIEEGKEQVYIPEIKQIMEDVHKIYNFGVTFKVDVHEWAGEKLDDYGIKLER